MSRSPSGSLVAHGTSRNLKSPARDEAAAGGQSDPPSRAPSRQEYDQSQNSYYDERVLKSPDTSTLLLFLSCHESLLSIYSMVCGNIQKSLTGNTTPQSEEFGSRRASELHQDIPTNGTGTLIPSNRKVRGDQNHGSKHFRSEPAPPESLVVNLFTECDSQHNVIENGAFHASFDVQLVHR